MTCRCSPSLLALRDQLDAAHPHRSTEGDGCCPSAAHHRRNPTSDHEPDRNGYAHAYDITQDPAHGVDCNLLAVSLITDPRLKYAIWNRRIYDPAVSKTWRRYTGTDPHTGHLHLSILETATLDTRPWPIKGTPPAPQPAPAQQEDDMPALRIVKEAENPAHQWLIGPGIAYHIPDGNQLGQLEALYGKADAHDPSTIARAVIVAHGKTGVTP